MRHWDSSTKKNLLWRMRVHPACRVRRRPPRHVREAFTEWNSFFSNHLRVFWRGKCLDEIPGRPRRVGGRSAVFCCHGNTDAFDSQLCDFVYLAKLRVCGLSDVFDVFKIIIINYYCNGIHASQLQDMYHIFWKYITTKSQTGNPNQSHILSTKYTCHWINF